MKVLMFNHAFFQLSETFIYKQVTGMPADVEIELLAFEINNEEKFPLKNKKYKVRRIGNIKERFFTAIRKYVFGIRYKTGSSAYAAIKKILEQTKYDIIHAHFGFNALLIFPLAKLFNIPLVVTFHGVDASPQRLKRREYRRRVKKMLEYASAIIIVSPHMKDTLQLKEHAGKTYLIPCGVDPEEFKPGEKLNTTAPFIILHSGRLVSKKGVPDLVKVFASLSRRYSNIRLIVIGHGPEINQCKQFAKRAANNSVQFLGARSHDEVRNFMAEADVFVLNSRTGADGDMEGLPVSLLEAMSMQLAVISTRHAGIPVAITDELDGVLIDEKNNSALSSALETLIKDAALRKRLGEAARQTIIDRFTDVETNNKIAGVYRLIFNYPEK
jgi:colanic acid/amylovoran biosynthesis glycosyltransferase